MTVPRNLQLELIAGARSRVMDVICRSGEVWILRPDHAGGPVSAEGLLGRSLPPVPLVIGLWGRDPARLDLAAFVAAITGVAQGLLLSEMDLERGYHRLTGGAHRSPTTLVVDAAERLAPEVIHYIQFAFIMSPGLQVVFVAGSRFRERLGKTPFLRSRLQPDLVLPPLSTEGRPPPRTALHGPGLTLRIERAEQFGPHGEPGFER